MAYNPVNPNGQATSANSAPVVIASDQSAVKIDVNDGSGNTINSTSNALNVFTSGTVGTTAASINTGQKTVGTSATQLSSTSTTPTNGIFVQALSTNNSGGVFIGGSGVTTSTGYQLLPGQATSLTCNLNTIYAIGSASGDAVCWSVI
jgi:hypothetical protein